MIFENCKLLLSCFILSFFNQTVGLFMMCSDKLYTFIFFETSCKTHWGKLTNSDFSVLRWWIYSEAVCWTSVGLLCSWSNWVTSSVANLILGRWWCVLHNRFKLTTFIRIGIQIGILFVVSHTNIILWWWWWLLLLLQASVSFAQKSLVEISSKSTFSTSQSLYFYRSTF